MNSSEVENRENVWGGAWGRRLAIIEACCTEVRWGLGEEKIKEKVWGGAYGMLDRIEACLLIAPLSHLGLVHQPMAMIVGLPILLLLHYLILLELKHNILITLPGSNHFLMHLVYIIIFFSYSV